MSPADQSRAGASPAGAVVALKPSWAAKSRLVDVEVPLRRRLAQAMALDTLAALQAASVAIVVVTDDPVLPGVLTRARIEATVLPEPSPPGMNAALRFGAQRLRQTGHDPVLACVGDLPALTAESVRRVLRAAGDQDRVFVPDAAGVGTTMLVAAGTSLDPRFQGRSGAKHRATGATAITEMLTSELILDARTDVDDLAALADAVAIGVGSHTSLLVDQQAGTVAEYLPITVAAGADDRGYPVITDAGVRLRLPVAAVDQRVRLLRPGQRLHAARADDRILSAWF